MTWMPLVSNKTASDNLVAGVTVRAHFEHLGTTTAVSPAEPCRKCSATARSDSIRRRRLTWKLRFGLEFEASGFATPTPNLQPRP